MVDTVNRLEGLPPLRPPDGSETPAAELGWERPTTDAAAFQTARVKEQRLPTYYRSLLRRVRERRVDYAMIPATLALSVLVGAAIATAFR